MEKRIVFSDNGTLSDYSVNLNNYQSGTSALVMVAAEDYLYIGSRHPFNSVFIKMGTANTNSASLTVNYWDGDNWRAVVDTIDETSGLTDSGHVTWTPDLDYSWSKEHTNHNGETITGLSDVVIYSQYWVRIKASADFSAGTTISYVGDLFCNDDDLEAEFPDFGLSATKTSFESGKTDWEEQRIIASRIMVQDLVDKGIIKGSENILNRRDYREASVMKTAEIIFRSFGDDFIDQKTQARDEYQSRLKKRIHRVDLNSNATEDDYEGVNETGFLSR